MGGRGANTGVARDINVDTNNIQQAVSNADAKRRNDATFTDKDNAPYHELRGGRNYYRSQSMSLETAQAVDTYLYPQNIYDPITGSSMYNPAQIINNALRKQLPMNGAIRAMCNDLDAGMHNLGINATLTRYERTDFLQHFGLSPSVLRDTPANMAKITKALSGATYVDLGYGSTSFNNFKNAPANNPFTDKAIKINISAPAKTQCLMPGTGAGGDFGELLLARGARYRVTGFRFSKDSSGYTIQGRSGANYYDRLEVDVEIY